MNKRLPRNNMITASYQQGFTLLEMILVVFIMGTLATVSLSFIENEDSQWRYDESLRKMAMVRDAVLKVRDYKSQQIMSGFVFDNGGLPNNTGPFDQLIDHGSLQLFSEKEPHYFYDAGNSAVQLSDISDINNLKDEELTIFKGYRTGAYLSSGLDSDNKFVDGWGNNFTVTLGENDTTYTVKLDSSSRTAPYDKEPKVELYQNNWAIPADQINNLKIKIENNTGSAFPPPPELGNSAYSINLYIVLFIYKNNVETGVKEWVNYRSDQITLFSGENPENPENLKIQIPEGPTNFTLTRRLVDGDERSIDNTHLIPAGTHLLALIDNSKLIGTPTAGDIAYKTASGNLVYQKFTLFPGSSLPELKLTIKE